MSINDLQDDGSFEWVIRGEGYSLACEPQTGKWRADVDDNASHRSVPALGVWDKRQAEAASDRLLRDFPSGIGHIRAMQLSQAMHEMFA